MINDSQSILLDKPREAAAPSTGAPLRSAGTHLATADRLGALRDLPGFWEGTGFSLIARPDFSGNSPNGFFLELSELRETIEFTTIGSPVFNRGSLQDDIAIFGVTYLHRVTDGVTGGALHIEPGMWLNIPATTEPKADASVARLATIPHGNAFTTVGFVQHAEFDRLPDIPPANTVPFDIDGQPLAPGTKNPYPEYDLGTPSAFRSGPLPASITQAIVDDPNQMLRDTLARQVDEQGMTLKTITRLITSTASAGGIGNIPFITSNANTLSLESVFAIELVEDASGAEFLQLQYSQTALLNFRGKSFPHVTVGTLIKAF
ncbi:heme-binding protein [Azospirillum formosense]|uniref:heme-binding protein n=1 Tax=Azospirillum formosense TaxID=861533 RepID=UPI00338F715F